MKADRPKFRISVNNRDITSDITAYVASVSYTDRVAGQSDEVEIVLNNSDLRFLNDWYFTKNDSLTLAIGYNDSLTECGTFTIDQIEPSGPPDTVTVRALAAGTNSPLRTKKTVAHEDKTLRDIAQAVADTHGYTVNDGTSFTHRVQQDWKFERTNLQAASNAIYAALANPTIANTIPQAYYYYPIMLEVANGLTQKGRQSDGTIIRQHTELWGRAWVNRTLPTIEATKTIARNTADKYTAFAATLVDVDKTTTRSKLDTVIKWHTQNDETDLQYLTRISKAYGVLFSVRGNVLIFTSIYDVEAQPTLDTITRDGVKAYRFSDRQVKTYAGAEVSWHNPDTGEAITSKITAETPPPTAMPGSYQVFGEVQKFGRGEILQIRQRVETPAHALEVAKAALHDHVSREFEGDIEIIGSASYVAGINIELSGFGVMDGKWAVTESAHRIDSGSGYSTSLKIKRGR